MAALILVGVLCPGEGLWASVGVVEERAGLSSRNLAILKERRYDLYKQ